MTTLKELIQEIRDNSQWKERSDKTSYFTVDYDNCTHGRLVQDAIMKAHQDRFPSDSIFEILDDVITGFLENDCECSEDFDEYTHEILDADIYTHDLTKWLGENNNNVYYLTSALEEFELKDGFQALAMAQHLFKLETSSIFLSVLENGLEELEENQDAA